MATPESSRSKRLYKIPDLNTDFIIAENEEVVDVFLNATDLITDENKTLNLETQLLNSDKLNYLQTNMLRRLNVASSNEMIKARSQPERVQEIVTKRERIRNLIEQSKFRVFIRLPQT